MCGFGVWGGVVGHCVAASVSMSERLVLPFPSRAQVIFCDSDQVVRADLTELWRMDLQARGGGTFLISGGTAWQGWGAWRSGPRN